MSGKNFHQLNSVSSLKLLYSRHYFIVLTLILTVFYFSFGTYRNLPYKIESDGKYYYQYLVSITFDKDIDFTNNYRVKQHPWMETEIDHYHFRDSVSSTTGKPINVFTIGPAILWAPFFLITLAVGKVLTFLNFSIDMNPFGKYFQYSVMYSGVFYCVAGLALLHKILNNYFSDSISKISIWLILITSPLFYYTIFEVSMSHVYDFFTFTLLIYVFVNVSKRRSWSYFIVLGLVGALHVLIRTQNIITVFIFSLILLIQYQRELRSFEWELWGKLLLYTATIAIGLLPLL